MKFIPYQGQVEIETIQKKSVIHGDDKELLEMGKVVAVGEGVTFLKIGDIVHFESYGCGKTAPVDGIVHYVVQVNESVIRGKHVEE